MKLKLFTHSFLLLSISLLLLNCKKEKVPSPTTVDTPKPSKWEMIPGKYKVYDTLNNFLYEMEITHLTGKDSLGKTTDSLHFENFDGNFNITADNTIANGQPSVGQPENYFYIGDYLPLVDKNNKRWRILSQTSPDYNALVEDTIKLRFHKCNIIYYLDDCTPYFCETVYQIAVKEK